MTRGMILEAAATLERELGATEAEALPGWPGAPAHGTASGQTDVHSCVSVTFMP